MHNRRCKIFNMRVSLSQRSIHIQNTGDDVFRRWQTRRMSLRQPLFLSSLNTMHYTWDTDTNLWSHLCFRQYHLQSKTCYTFRLFHKIIIRHKYQKYKRGMRFMYNITSWKLTSDVIQIKPREVQGRRLGGDTGAAAQGSRVKGAARWVANLITYMNMWILCAQHILSYWYK